MSWSALSACVLSNGASRGSANGSKIRPSAIHRISCAPTEKEPELELSLASVMGPPCCHEHGTTWGCQRAWWGCLSVSTEVRGVLTDGVSSSVVGRRSLTATGSSQWGHAPPGPIRVHGRLRRNTTARRGIAVRTRRTRRTGRSWCLCGSGPLAPSPSVLRVGGYAGRRSVGRRDGRSVDGGSG